MKRRHVPIRTCTGCRQPAPKREMIRVVRTPEGGLELDPTGKKSGRGAYVCPKAECVERALGRRGLETVLEVAVPTGLAEKLRRLVDGDGSDG